MVLLLLFVGVNAQSSKIPQAPYTGCHALVTAYWGYLIQGDPTKAFALYNSNVSFEWPGDKSVLPMAGTWYGPAGVGQFFGIVGQYFGFSLCGGIAPNINRISSSRTMAWAYWEECNPLKGTTTIPCPNTLNQAMYYCDSNFTQILRVRVSLDNSCTAQAICSSTSKQLQCS